MFRADCHDAEMKKGNLDLASLKSDLSNPDTFALWLTLHDRVAAGEMPPKKKNQPAADERQAFLHLIGDGLLNFELARAAESGRSTLRRINRIEYENTLRDLLALPLLRVKDLLPEDGRQFGFDKVGGALDISHIQMTKYLQAADIALRQAVVKTASRPETIKWREPAAQQDTARGAIAAHCAVPLKGLDLAAGGRSRQQRLDRQPWHIGQLMSLHVLNSKKVWSYYRHFSNEKCV